VDRRCTFLCACLPTIQKPGLSILFCQSRPSMYQCEKSFTPCGNGLSPVLALQKRKWPVTLFLLLQLRTFFALVRGWQKQTMQLRQPLASPRCLLLLNKLRSPDLRQFANSIMKESYQPSPTVAENGRLSELSCLEIRPFLETPLLTPNTNPTCDLHESY
jgi:hypothetical protein